MRTAVGGPFHAVLAAVELFVDIHHRLDGMRENLRQVFCFVLIGVEQQGASSFCQVVPFVGIFLDELIDEQRSYLNYQRFVDGLVSFSGSSHHQQLQHPLQVYQHAQLVQNPVVEVFDQFGQLLPSVFAVMVVCVVGCIHQHLSQEEPHLAFHFRQRWVIATHFLPVGFVELIRLIPFLFGPHVLIKKLSHQNGQVVG